MFKKYEKIGGGGSLLAARSKGFRLSSLRGEHEVFDAAIQANTPRLFSGLPRSRWSLAKTRNVDREHASPLRRAVDPAFTMAEILLSLTIIGVVAAITLPSLTGNVNERVWNTQRKAMYARFSQAIALLPSLNGYGTLVEGTDTVSAQDTATETFLTEGLSKVLKINNICDHEHLGDCGVPTSFTNLAGSKMAMPTTLYGLNIGFKNVEEYEGLSFSAIDTKAAAFETQNGESIAVFYYQSCPPQLPTGINLDGNSFANPQANMCLNFVYDLNGTKGPNAMGKDIGFITAFNSIDPTLVMPMPNATNAGGASGAYAWHDAANACTTQDVESRLPNINELSAMFINKDLVGLSGDAAFWSGTNYSADYAYGGEVYEGVMSTGVLGKGYTLSVRCIKR